MMESFESHLHIRFQDDDYMEITRTYYKNKEEDSNTDNTETIDDMIMVYRMTPCILVEDNKSTVSENVKRMTITLCSDNMDVYFPLVVNGIRAIPETIEEISIELPKKSNKKKLFTNDLIVDGISGFHDNINTINIMGDLVDPLIVKNQRVLPANLKSITLNKFSSPFIIDDISIFPDSLESVYIYHDKQYEHSFGQIIHKIHQDTNEYSIIKAFPDNVIKFHYYINTGRQNFKPNIFFLGGISLLPANLRVLELSVDNTIEFIKDGVRLIPENTQKVTLHYVTNSVLSFVSNGISIFPDSVTNLQIYSLNKSLTIKMMDNEIFGLPRNIIKFVLDAKSVTFDDTYNDNNISPFPDRLEKLTISGKDLTVSDMPIFSPKIKKLTLQLSDWDNVKYNSFFPINLEELNILRQFFPIRNIHTNYDIIAVKICYKYGLCILPPNIKCVKIDYEDVTTISLKLMAMVTLLPYPIADEIINEL